MGKRLNNTVQRLCEFETLYVGACKYNYRLYIGDQGIADTSLTSESQSLNASSQL